MDPAGTASFDGTDDAGPRRAAEERYLSKAITQKIRDEWVRDQMRARRDEYTTYHHLSVFLGTWNVNGKKPSENLEAWLSVGAAQSMPDIYVLGFQEVVDLTAGNVVLDSSSKERSQLWVESLAGTLSRMYGGRRYQLVAERHLVGVMLCVFMLDKHVPKTPRVSIQSTVTATGVMGMGNKGGVCLRVQLYDTTFCFVCAHLAAHRDAVESRNSDYRNIMIKSTFRDEAQGLAQRSAEVRLSAPVDATQLVPEGASSYRKAAADTEGEGEEANLGTLTLEPVLGQPTFGIIDHDYVFWLGDFNYRIQVEHSIETVFKRIEAGDLAWLRANDQLLAEQAASRAFAGFKEAEIQFLPTYKFQTGTNQYDRRPEKKVRAPAYCDRILWRDVGDSHARIQKYVSCPTLCSSDHKPVIALFDVRVKERVPDARSRVFQEIIRGLDKWENDERPQVTLDRQAVSFPGGLAYMERREEKILVTNVGRVPVAWRFVPKLEDLTISKPWLHVEPDFGLLPPGASATISMVALVDAIVARTVATEQDTLDDILVMRLEGGRDHFICASATLVPTCFGMELSKLVRAHAPVAATPEEREAVLLDRTSRFGADKAAHPLRLPKEIWWLCNFLWVYDLLKVPSLFVLSARKASPEKLAYVRRCVDTGHELVPEEGGHAMAHAVAAVVLEFLRGLPEPIVPFALFPRVDVDNTAMEAWGRRFLDQLPPLSHNVFVYTVTFLREVVKNQTYNRVRARELAALFAQCLLRPSELVERQRDTSPQTNIPFDLPNWITGEKKETTLNQMAEKVVLHFIQADRAFLF